MKHRDESANKHTLAPNGKEKRMRQHDAEGQTAYSSSPDRTSGGRKHVVCAAANQSDRRHH